MPKWTALSTLASACLIAFAGSAFAGPSDTPVKDVKQQGSSISKDEACKTSKDGQTREPACCGQCTTSGGKRGCESESNGKKTCTAC